MRDTSLTFFGEREYTEWLPIFGEDKWGVSDYRSPDNMGQIPKVYGGMAIW
jgi:hypothetical protein